MLTVDKNLPSISIIIPTYNSSRTLRRCLGSIASQHYPRDKIEILIVDDDSTDDTIDIAKEHNTKVLRNGAHDCQIGKSIGLRNAKNELILFIDSDNVLPSKNWILRIVEPLLEHKGIVGAEPIWFYYNREGNVLERYCSLFGVDDPLAFYLKRRDRLMWTEKEWNLLGRSENKGNYYIVTFEDDDVPTLGSVGFIARKDLLLKTYCQPFFFHMDSCYELIQKGYNKFALVKISIIHLHSNSILSFLKKLRQRSERALLKYKSKRRYKWVTDPIKFMATIITMFTVIKPTYDSVKGYRKIRDIAWFLNPILCFLVVLLYGTTLIKAYIRTYSS